MLVSRGLPSSGGHMGQQMKYTGQLSGSQVSGRKIKRAAGDVSAGYPTVTFLCQYSSQLCSEHSPSHSQGSVTVTFPSHQQMETTTDRQLVNIQRTLTVGHPAHTSPTQPLYLPRAQRTSRKKAEKDEKSQKTRESAAGLRVPDITWKLYP